MPLDDAPVVRDMALALVVFRDRYPALSDCCEQEPLGLRRCGRCRDNASFHRTCAVCDTDVPDDRDAIAAHLTTCPGA
jgi:hypothetical protein